jgi:hypothetical protein
MSFYQFRATVGEDQVIRLPDGVTIPPGEYAVIVSTPVQLPERDPSDPDSMAATSAWLLGIAAEAEAMDADLPDDMAENHTHYAHGAPKR